MNKSYSNYKKKNDFDKYTWLISGLAMSVYGITLVFSWVAAYQTFTKDLVRQSHAAAIEIQGRLNRINSVIEGIATLGAISDITNRDLLDESTRMLKTVMPIMSGIMTFDLDRKAGNSRAIEQIKSRGIQKTVGECHKAIPNKVLSLVSMISYKNNNYILGCVKVNDSKKDLSNRLGFLIPGKLFLPSALTETLQLPLDMQGNVFIHLGSKIIRFSTLNPASPLRRKAKWASKFYRSTGFYRYRNNKGQSRVGAISLVNQWPITVRVSAPLMSVTKVWWASNNRMLLGLSLGIIAIIALMFSLKNKARSEFVQRQYHKALSEINSHVSHIPRPGELLQKSCDILVQGAELKLVWVGILDEGTGYLQILTRSGVASRYADNLIISVESDHPAGTGPAAECIRSGHMVLTRDFLSAENIGFWKKRVSEFGLRSSIMMPFTNDNDDRCVLGAYSDIKNAFSNETIRLIQDVAHSLSLGLKQFKNLEKITYLSLSDTLTGLSNRKYFVERLSKALIRAHRHELLIAIGILDIDNFKEVNDTFGHPVGDEYIKRISEILVNTLRQGDLVSRLGGDEFGLLIEDVRDVDELESLASRLLSNVRSRIELGGDASCIYPSVSIGFTLIPIDDSELNDLIKHADVALYKAKSMGKGRWCLFETAYATEAKEQYLFRNRLPDALDKEELELYFQPQVDISTHKIIGAEALIRWNYSNTEVIGPARFMPLIESDSFLIRDLGRYVLNKATSHLLEWHSKGHRVRLAVNIGARHITHSSFMDDIKEALDVYPDAAHWLTIEITEASSIYELDKCSQILECVRRLGIHTSLDDFGTGSSSLQYVQSIPLNEIKLDLKFVQHLNDDSDAFSIAHAAIELASVSRANVVAEGVETADIARLWRRLGGRYVQGYLFGKPMQNLQWIEWMKNFSLDNDYRAVPSWRVEQKLLPVLMAAPDCAQIMSKVLDALELNQPDIQYITNLIAELREIENTLILCLDNITPGNQTVRHYHTLFADMITMVEDAIFPISPVPGTRDCRIDVQNLIMRKKAEIQSQFECIMVEIDHRIFDQSKTLQNPVALKS